MSLLQLLLVFLSDQRLAFTVKLSCALWPGPVPRSRVDGAEQPAFPSGAAVLALGFDKCYQLL